MVSATVIRKLDVKCDNKADRQLGSSSMVVSHYKESNRKPLTKVRTLAVLGTTRVKNNTAQAVLKAIQKPSTYEVVSKGSGS